MKTKEKISILKKWCKDTNSISNRKFHVLPNIEYEDSLEIISVEVNCTHFISYGQIDIICKKTGLYFYGVMNLNGCIILQFTTEEY